MKNALKTMLLLLCMGVISVGLFSCETKAQKEAQAEAARIEAERLAEQERIAAEEKYRQQEQEEAERVFNRFVGTYTFYESKYEERYDVLSDGRIITDGSSGKEHCDDIVIISDDAFVIRISKRFTYYVGPVEVYVQRNGSEANDGRSTPYIENLVFEITTGRAYVDYDSYQNRDIVNAPYLKFKHFSSLL